MHRIHRSRSRRRLSYVPSLERIEARVVPSFVAPRAFAVEGAAVSVAVGEFNGDGRPDLAAANSDSGDISVLLGKGDGSFQAARSFSAGDYPFSVAVGEFNGDGRQDLAVGDDLSSNVSVLLGNGDGSFQGARHFYAGSYPWFVAVGDLNGDARADLVTGQFILLGNGDGTFQDARPHGGRGGPVAVGDLNGDNRQDLALAYTADSGAVIVLLGNGDGSFQPPQEFPVASEPRAVAVGEFNGDGLPDLAVNGSSMSVLLGNGDGSFQPARTFPTGNPYSVVVGEFNGDSYQDLVMATAILLGNGDGSFQPARHFYSGGDPWTVAVGEFNGDGLPDLAVADGYSYDVSVLLGYGDGSFETARGFPTGDGPNSVVAGEFNGDGRVDLAVANTNSHTVSVLLGAGDGSFQEARHFPAGSYPWSVAAADFNGDGRTDLAVTNLGDTTVTVLLGNGDGTFQAPRSFLAGNFPFALATGDFNSDGRTDLAVTNVEPCCEYADARISVLLGNGDGSFQDARSFPAGGNPLAVTVGDFNGDGRQDLAVANGGSPIYYPEDLVGMFLGNGDGTFLAIGNIAVDIGPMAVAVADVNRDGRQDLVTANYGHPNSIEPGTVSLLLGNGDGTFQAARHFTAGGRPVSVAVGDFNRDGFFDLAVVTGTVRVLLGNGSGSFQALPVSWVAGVDPLAVAVADFDGGGFLDLAVANNESDDVSILFNDAVWPGGPVAYYWIYADVYTATVGVPVDLGVFALNNIFSLVPEYTGEVLFVSTDALATTPGMYTFRPEDQGFALFADGVTFRTPGPQALLVIDTATWSVFGFVFFDVVAPYAGGAAGLGLDLFVSEVLGSGGKSARR